jgi:hypothetical protein
MFDDIKRILKSKGYDIDDFELIIYKVKAMEKYGISGHYIRYYKAEYFRTSPTDTLGTTIISPFFPDSVLIDYYYKLIDKQEKREVKVDTWITEGEVMEDNGLYMKKVFKLNKKVYEKLEAYKPYLKEEYFHIYSNFLTNRKLTEDFFSKYDIETNIFTDSKTVYLNVEISLEIEGYEMYNVKPIIKYIGGEKSELKDVVFKKEGNKVTLFVPFQGPSTYIGINYWLK